MSRIRPGMLTRGTAQEINQAVDRVGGLMNSGLAAGATRIGGVDGQFLNVADTDSVGNFFFAELTSSSEPFSWVERVESSAGTWADGIRSGENNAYQAQPSSEGLPPPDEGDLVLMRASPTVNGTYEFLALGLNTDPYPLDDMPCLNVVKDMDGKVTGVSMHQRWYDPTTGIATCRQADACEDGCTPE